MRPWQPVFWGCALAMWGVAAGPGQKVIQPNHSVALRQQAVAHVRSDKAGGAGNGNTQIHSKVLF